MPKLGLLVPSARLPGSYNTWTSTTSATFPGTGAALWFGPFRFEGLGLESLGVRVASVWLRWSQVGFGTSGSPSILVAVPGLRQGLL